MKKALAVVLTLLFLGVPMAFASSPAQGTQVEGWHLIESLYMVPDVDVDVNNGPVESMMMGVADGLLLDYYQDSGTEGDILLTHYRTGKDGNVFASTEWEVLWDAPPSYLTAEQSASITVEHRVLEVNSWEPPRLCAAFDAPDMEIGYVSSSPNRLHKPGTRQNPYRDETTEVYGGKAVMTTERPIAAGEEGDRMALYINFGEGYGMRYTYRWGMDYAAGETGGEEESGLGTKNTAALGSGQIFASPTAFETPGAQDIAVLWTNMNIYAVQNGAQDYYVIFALEDDSVVTEILTYHYLSSSAQPGQITLYAETGEEWGPFRAIGQDGQGGVENANWVADTGELALPAGRYAIADSDPSTWSCNAESGYWGMAEVRGYVRKTRGNPFAVADPPRQTPSANRQDRALGDLLVGLWLSERMESGEQLLMNVAPESMLDFSYCFYLGEGSAGVESLMDPSWRCLDLLVCDYSLAGNTLSIDSERGLQTALELAVVDNDTLHMVDEWGGFFAMHRATQAQADSWESWGWRFDYTGGYDGESPPGTRKPPWSNGWSGCG